MATFSSPVSGLFSSTLMPGEHPHGTFTDRMAFFETLIASANVFLTSLRRATTVNNDPAVWGGLLHVLFIKGITIRCS